MKRLLTIIAGAVLAIGLAQTPAQATTVNLGTIPDGGSLVTFGGNLGFGQFTDNLNFHLDANSSLSGFLKDVEVPVFANLTNLAISIDGTALALNPNTGGAYTGAVLALLSAGDHVFQITGKAIGLFGGAYRFSVAAVAATPIPPALLMFGTALAGLGFVGWRRRQALAA
jgi:hypothetical protein